MPPPRWQKVCAPSRASTMSGRYPFNVGFYEMPPDDANQCLANTTLLPQLLRDMGYSTHALGKWGKRLSCPCPCSCSCSCSCSCLRRHLCRCCHCSPLPTPAAAVTPAAPADGHPTRVADVGYIARICTPTHRGFDSFLGYYEACNHDLFYHTCGSCSPQTCGRKECQVDFSLNTGYEGSLHGAPTSLNGNRTDLGFGLHCSTDLRCNVVVSVRQGRTPRGRSRRGHRC